MAKIKATLIAFQLKDLNQTLISINTNTHHSKSKLTADSKVIYFRCDSFNVSTGAEETRSKYQRFAAVCVCGGGGGVQENVQHFHMWAINNMLTNCILIKYEST